MNRNNEKSSKIAYVKMWNSGCLYFFEIFIEDFV